MKQESQGGRRAGAGLVLVVCLCALLSGCRAWEDRARTGLRSTDSLERRQTLEKMKSDAPLALREDVEQVLGTDVEPANRALAADVLGVIGMRESLNQLRLYAVSDSSWLVRVRALTALTRIQGWRSSGDLQVALEKDPDATVRVEAVNLAAERLQSKSAAELIVRGLKDRDSAVRVAAYQKLVRLTGKNIPLADYEKWLKAVSEM